VADKETYDLVKILDETNRDLSNSVLLDCNPMSSLFYPWNQMVLKEFHPDDEYIVDFNKEIDILK